MTTSCGKDVTVSFQVLQFMPVKFSGNDFNDNNKTQRETFFFFLFANSILGFFFFLWELLQVSLGYRPNSHLVAFSMRIVGENRKTRNEKVLWFNQAGS